MSQEIVSKPIRVLYVVGNLDIGGAETHVTRIVTGFSPEVIKPTVFTILNKGVLAPVVEKQGIEVIGPLSGCYWADLNKIRKLGRVISGAWTLYRYLRRYKPDIIHYYLPMPYLVGGLVSIVAGIKVRIMSRRSLNYYQNKYRISAKLERWLHKRMTRILGNSKAVLNDLKDEGVPDKRLEIIYNGVELLALAKNCCKSIYDEFGLTDSILVMTIVANLIPYKGHKDLISALSIVHKELPTGWRLLCVGDDCRGVRSSLEVQVAECGLTQHITFLGSRNDVAEILHCSDIAILSSHEEGFSNAVLEGMAAGLPSIVTNVGGNSEAIRNNVDGLVVPKKSIEKMSAAIIQLANNAELRTLMGDSARKRIEDLFSMDQCIRNYQDLYQSVI